MGKAKALVDWSREPSVEVGLELGVYVEDEDETLMRRVYLPDKVCGRICGKTNKVCHRRGTVTGLAGDYRWLT